MTAAINTVVVEQNSVDAFVNVGFVAEEVSVSVASPTP